MEFKYGDGELSDDSTLAMTSSAPPMRRLDWAIIKEALRRPLTTSERECVIDLVELYASCFAQARASRVTSRDIKRTLGVLVRAEPDAACKAYARADGWTQAHIADALRRAGIRDEAVASPSGEQIVSAAKSAIASIATRASDRPDDSEFPRAIIALWRDLGGGLWSPSANDDYGTPIVRFAAALFRAAGAPPSDLPAIAARLRTAA